MTTKTSRQIALERRIAMSDGGKKSLIKSSSRQDRVRSASDARVSSDISVNKSSVVTKISKSSTKKYSTPLKSSSLTSRELVLQRRKALSTHGKPAMNSSDRTRTEIASNKNTEISINPVEVKENNSTPIKKVTHKRRVSSKRKVISNTSRDIVLARREAQSKHGKSAIKQNTSAASLARSNTN